MNKVFSLKSSIIAVYSIFLILTGLQYFGVWDMKPFYFAWQTLGIIGLLIFIVVNVNTQEQSDLSKKIISTLMKVFFLTCTFLFAYYGFNEQKYRWSFIVIAVLFFILLLSYLSTNGKGVKKRDTSNLTKI